MALLNKLLNGTAKPATPSAGKLIVIDGSDGSGKATQVDLLAQTLASSGYDGVVFDFPQYNTASSAPLEKYLAGDYGPMHPKAASTLYAIDRFDASAKLREYLAAGKIVIANRYVTSNAGHQGAKIADHSERVAFYKWLENLEYVCFNIPRPDLTVILHVPADITWELITERAKTEDRPKDVMHETDPAHLQAAEKAFLEVANLFPNSKLVECVEQGQLLSPQRIHGKVWDLVRRIALKDLVRIQ